MIPLFPYQKGRKATMSVHITGYWPNYKSVHAKPCYILITDRWYHYSRPAVQKSSSASGRDRLHRPLWWRHELVVPRTRAKAVRAVHRLHGKPRNNGDDGKGVTNREGDRQYLSRLDGHRTAVPAFWVTSLPASAVHIIAAAPSPVGKLDC
jgi:hypothetical protein